MRSNILFLFALGVGVMALALFAATSFNSGAQAASSKAGGITSQDATILSEGATVDANGDGETDYVTFLAGDIQTSQWADVVMDVSLECGVYTETLVKSKGGNSDTSRAEAGVQVRVLVDGVMAEPNGLRGDQGVIFCSRMQEQTAVFNGFYENCVDANGDGSISLDECDLTEEELKLVLDTMGAHSFNFFLTDLDQGDHHIEVQARIWENTYAEAGSAVAGASIGMGSVSVDEVKFVKGYTP